MKPRFTTGTFVLITSVTLLVVIGIIWFFASSKSRSDDRMLQAKFDQSQGNDGDPSIQFFLDNGQKSVAFLARQMKSKDRSVQVKALIALRQMGPSYTDSDIGLAALCAALNASDNEVRSRAEGALGDLGPKAKVAVPAIIKSISKGVDINGVWALGRIGPDANAALPVLESKMRRQTGSEQVYAAGAVWAIGGENAEEKAVIEKALQDPDKHIQTAAHNVLAEHPEISSQ